MIHRGEIRTYVQFAQCIYYVDTRTRTRTHTHTNSHSQFCISALFLFIIFPAISNDLIGKKAKNKILSFVVICDFETSLLSNLLVFSFFDLELT